MRNLVAYAKKRNILSRWFHFFSIRCFIFCVRNNLVKMYPIWLAHISSTGLWKRLPLSCSLKRLQLQPRSWSFLFQYTAKHFLEQHEASICFTSSMIDRLNFSMFLEVIPLKTIMTFECFRHLFHLIAYRWILTLSSKTDLMHQKRFVHEARFDLLLIYQDV